MQRTTGCSMVVSVGTMALALLLMSLAPAHAMGVATPKGFPSATAPRTLLGDATSHTVSGPCGVLAACMNPTACPIMSEVPPPAFGVVIATTVGSFTIHVNTSWAPPYAQRLWVMARLDYMTGGPFFRVLNMNDGQETFVAQFGYRGDPAVDGCWNANLTSNTTWSVHSPGNIRGTVSFAMDAVSNDGSNPNCSATSSYCAQGFSTNIFVNLQDNSKLLDGPGFSPVGTVSDADMVVVDKLYAGYGEVASLCPAGARDPFCVGTGQACQGVNVTDLLTDGSAYVRASKPLLDVVTGMKVVS